MELNKEMREISGRIAQRIADKLFASFLIEQGEMMVERAQALRSEAEHLDRTISLLFAEASDLMEASESHDAVKPTVDHAPGAAMDGHRGG